MTHASRRTCARRMNKEESDYLQRMHEVLISEPCRGLPKEPSHIFGHVYIGSQSNAESLRLLRRLRITHVLNCAGYKGPRPSPDASPYEGLGIDYYEFKAEDDDFYDITQHFREAFSYIDKVERRGGRVLVHCAMGINRSAAVCLAYLMMHEGTTLLKATRLIKEKRRVVLSNRGFQLQLVQFARSKALLDTIPAQCDKRSTTDVYHSESRLASRYAYETDSSSDRDARSARYDSHSGSTRPSFHREEDDLDVLSMRIRESLDCSNSRAGEAGHSYAGTRVLERQRDSPAAIQRHTSSLSTAHYLPRGNTF